jgi:hypothetical protein
MGQDYYCFSNGFNIGSPGKMPVSNASPALFAVSPYTHFLALVR